MAARITRAITAIACACIVSGTADRAAAQDSHDSAWRLYLDGLGLAGSPGETLDFLLPAASTVNGESTVVNDERGYVRARLTIPDVPPQSIRITIKDSKRSIPVNDASQLGSAYTLAVFAHPAFDDMSDAALNEWIAIARASDAAGIVVVGVIARSDLESAADRFSRFVGEMDRPVLLCPDARMVATEPALAEPRAVRFGEDSLLVVPPIDVRNPGTEAMLQSLRRAHQPSRRVLAIAGSDLSALPPRYQLVLDWDDPATFLPVPENAQRPSFDVLSVTATDVAQPERVE